VALLEHTFRWRHTHLHTFGSPPARRLSSWRSKCSVRIFYFCV